MQKAVESAFCGAFPTVHHCKDEQLLEDHWKYPDSILSFPAVYKSSKGAFLVEVGVNASDCGWVTEPDDPQSIFVAQWFLVAPGKPARKIGGFGDLLDAGDYDNDGVSEFIPFLQILSMPTDTRRFLTIFRKPST